MTYYDDTECPRCEGTGQVAYGYIRMEPDRPCSDCYGTGIAGMDMIRLEREKPRYRPAHEG